MKRTVLVATAAFWAGAAALVIAAREPATPGVGAPASFTLAQVAAHADAKSCWMAIHGKVYDVTAYIDLHPADPQVILKHCGKEASRGWDTKDAGRPHSSRAATLLERYYIGELPR